MLFDITSVTSDGVFVNFYRKSTGKALQNRIICKRMFYKNYILFTRTVV